MSKNETAGAPGSHRADADGGAPHVEGEQLHELVDPREVDDPELVASLDPSLYNADLAPTRRSSRRWHAYNIFTLWANDVHSLGNYTFAIGLFALGLGVWQILVAFLAGSVLLFALLSLSGYMGEKTGVPFPVLSRIAFGIRGAHIPAVIRGFVAIVWFGIQTYLASLVARVMVIALIPAAAAWDENSFLGLSTLGWITFLGLWIIQQIIVARGLEVIRHYEAFAGPVILVTMLLIALWVLWSNDWSIAMTPPDQLTGGAMWVEIFGAASLWVAIYGTFVLNFSDFTRNAVSKRSILTGNFVGIPINTMFFAAIVVVLAGGQFKLNGTIIANPADVVKTIPNTLLLSLACLALIILTIAVNLMANFVAPIYTLNNLFPRFFDFRRAGLMSGVLGVIILPWNLYNTPVIVNYFLGGVGAILGPIFGVMMADYWLIRRAQINVPDLFRNAAGSDYAYSKGVHAKAIIALVPASILSIVLALVPAFHAVSLYSWFVGAISGAVIYLAITRRSALPIRDVAGEPIAIASAGH